ncbi:hypothetical protein [Phenylobacterium sp.]|uniref:hypothetical protein n=1 Tax=Phenylobacterium sp. TaxID=1871053 RepID=UPI00286E36AF|nr:hypothetical protein [Phenylobacterium sp.]
MPRNIRGRLDRLKQRRSGTDRLDWLIESERADILLKSILDEPWQKRVSVNTPNTRYAIGSMAQVEPEYTAISLETATRVGKQLKANLEAAGFSIEFRLQGSVPLDVHIRGVSDVDLLTLDTQILIYCSDGVLGQSGYYSPSKMTSLEALKKLRAQAEVILTTKFPAAKVDCTGGKAICISGGSLARPVDVVPSIWWDTVDYQTTRQEHDRGVNILNRKVPETLQNQPFRHIKRINDFDAVARGGLKKAIRLCKHVKNDAQEEGTVIDLPSFDIAATMYHANLQQLSTNQYYELGVLAETQRHLDFLATNHDEARKLYVPDGSRKIFDSSDKLRGLNALSTEMDDLMTEVAKEQAPLLGATPSWYDSRNVLAKSIVAG